MSQMSQTENTSVRAYVFRFAQELGHCSTQSTCQKCQKRDLALGRHARALLNPALLQHSRARQSAQAIAIDDQPEKIRPVNYGISLNQLIRDIASRMARQLLRY